MLLQDDNSTTMGGAFLPAVNGHILKPALIDVTQFPLAGVPREEGTLTVITVNGSNPLTNQTLSCKWRVSVEGILVSGDGWFVSFAARKGNTSNVKTYDLRFPVVGKFFRIGSFAEDWSYALTRTSSLTVTFKRVENTNATNATVIHRTRYAVNTGIPDYTEELVPTPVSFPDYTHRYQVEFKARNFKRSVDVLFFLYTQAKKLIAEYK